MFMGEQMILAVFIISCTFGTKTKFQVISVLFGTATDRTAMMGTLYSGRLYFFLIGSAPLDVFG